MEWDGYRADNLYQEQKTPNFLTTVNRYWSIRFIAYGETGLLNGAFTEHISNYSIRKDFLRYKKN